MKLILYSSPEKTVFERIESELFPLSQKIVFGYMPANGADPHPEFTPFWENLAAKHNAEFVYIDNSKTPTQNELKKIKTVNSLTVTGGNAFDLLQNLRNNGFDKIIIRLCRKPDFVYSGFSAGAVIATPDIKLVGKKFGADFGYDENNTGITDTAALGLVDFEILPHYNPNKDKEKLVKYRKQNSREIKALTDQDFIMEERTNFL